MPSWVVVGPGDDAAVIEHERGALDVLTTDAQVEGVHFDRRFMPPEAIGHRALAVNLSDLAAMGARPRAALLSLALPDDLEIDVLDGVVEGLLGLAALHGVTLIGGNVTRSPGPMMIDVTVTGTVGRRRVLTRGGARPGDEVYVTGAIGDAAAGLAALQEHGGAGPPELREGIERFLRPEPRIRAGLLLGRNRAASACMDLSDGLADGLRQIAAASEVGIAIDAASLPISAGVRRWHDARGADPVMAAVAGGDDYELLFTVRPTRRGRLRAVRRVLGSLALTRIGLVTASRELRVTRPEGTSPLPEGYEHFR